MTNPLFSAATCPTDTRLASQSGRLTRHSRRWVLSVKPVVCAVLVALLALTQPLMAQDDGNRPNLLDLGLGGPPAGQNLSAKVTTSLSPESVKPGDIVTLSIAVEVPEGAHIYSLDKSFGGSTKVKISAEEGVEPQSEFTPSSPAVVRFIKEFDQDVGEYEAGTVTFSRTYKVKADAKKVRITGVLDYQVCDKSNCLPAKKPFDEALTVGAGAKVVLATPGRATGTLIEEPRIGDSNGGRETKSQFTLLTAQPKLPAISTVRLVPADAKPGDTVTLEIRIDLQPKWHTFSTTLPEERAGTATELEIDSHTGLTPIGSEFKPDRAHTIHVVKPESVELEQEIYEEHVTWSRTFKLDAGKSMSDVRVKGSLAFQVCDEGRCITAKKVNFELPTGGSDASPPGPKDASESPTRGAPAGPLTPDRKTPELTTDVDAKPAGGGVTDLSGTDCEGSASETDIRSKGVVYVLGAAFVFGLLALLTPCVFPMVPITVSFFLKQAEKRHSSPLKMALVYSGSIILTFTVLGLVVSSLFGAASINTLANGIWLNLFLGLVLMFFAFNLLGLFEIIIPSWLLTFTGSKESSGGYLGVFFMALTFTLTSFTCTFAFLGLILVWAANGEIWWPLAGLVAFSTAFALPFFLLALFPSYLHKLPKSGGWMNRVKVVMGFIELAFMFKFLSVADIGWNGGPTVLDYHIVMMAWMVISAVTGLYLIGKIQLSHDTPTQYVGVFPMVLSMFFFGLSGYIGIGLFAPKPPEGFLGRQIAAFAPPQLSGGIGPDGPYLVGEHDKQRYLLDFEAAKQASIREKKPLYIDFTGVNCVNCRLMEKEVIAEDAIQKKLENCIRVQLYCDVMPSKGVTDPVLANKLIEANQKLQQSWMGDASLPSYAFVSPDGATILSKTTGRVSTATFSAFMTCGAQKLRKIKEQGVAATAAEGSTPYIIRGADEKWFLDFEGAKKVAQVKGLPLAVSFTSVNDMGRIETERRLSQPNIKKVLDDTVRVTLYVDDIPRGAGIDPQLAEQMVEKNRILHERLMLNAGTSFVLLKADGQILTQVLGSASDADVLASLENGLHRNGLHRQDVDKNSRSVALVNSQ